VRQWAVATTTLQTGRYVIFICSYSAPRPAADAQLSICIAELTPERCRFLSADLAVIVSKVPSRQPQARTPHRSSQAGCKKEVTPKGSGDCVASDFSPGSAESDQVHGSNRQRPS
jgi:hypothetical protein